jgi:hypothetical protein
MRQNLRPFDLVVVSPHPSNFEPFDGWSRRIHDIDFLISEHERLYVNLSESNPKNSEYLIFQKSHNSFEIFLNPKDTDDNYMLEKAIFSESKVVYIQTLHQADLVIDTIGDTQFVLDMHGIVPEEEAMQENYEAERHYQQVELKIISKAFLVVTVSHAMTQHFLKKYPGLKSSKFQELVIKPESFSMNEIVFDDFADADELPVKVVYAGGFQSWQNVPAMLQLAEESSSFAEFTICSANYEQILQSVKERKLSNVSLRFAPHAKIVEIYQLNHFGLILRDDSAVNRVASPTKLFEYISTGLVPIVRNPHLGDAMFYGYAYVLEADFRDGFLPDRVSRRSMVENNLEVAKTIQTLQLDQQTVLRIKLDEILRDSG